MSLPSSPGPPTHKLASRGQRSSMAIRASLSQAGFVQSLKERSQVKQEAQLLLGDRATRKHAKDC